MTTDPATELEREIGYVFRDRSLLDHALTHSSTGPDVNNERLEFLGDRVLGLAISEILYEKFPREREGDLARRLAALVQGEFLAKMAKKIQLGKYLNISQAEKAAGGDKKTTILADALEALIGAVYLDCKDQDDARDVCRKLIETLWGEDFFAVQSPPQHPKTALQEWAQAQGLPLPQYDIVSQSGPDHAPLFKVAVMIEGYEAVTAENNSRQAAEKEAASMFLSKAGLADQ